MKTNRKNLKHGMTKTLAYQSWSAMHRRCFDASYHDFAKYGANGITACGFLKATPINLVAVIGKRPSSEYSLDRYPDNGGNYTCGNCSQCLEMGWALNIRWATDIEQARNTKNNVIMTVDGVRGCVTEFAKKYGIKRGTVYYRIQNGDTDPLRPVPVRSKRS